jgi:excisionase family DNA binding protein
VVSGRRAEATPRERLLTVVEVANVLNVATATVYKLCAQGKLPHIRVLSVLRFEVQAVRGIIREGAAKRSGSTSSRHSKGGAPA